MLLLLCNGVLYLAYYDERMQVRVEMEDRPMMPTVTRWIASVADKVHASLRDFYKVSCTLPDEPLIEIVYADEQATEELAGVCA